MLERLARLGYASKALIYFIVGALAGAAALGAGGRVTDTSGAMRTILSQPFGPFVLLVLGVGLVGYATWRVLDAIRDPDHRGHAFQAAVIRIGSVVRAVIYGALGVEALRLARGLRRSSGQQAEVWAARIMTWPLGEWVLGITGLIVAAYGVSQVVTAIRGKANEDLDLSAMSSAARKAAIRPCGRCSVESHPSPEAVSALSSARQLDDPQIPGFRGLHWREHRDPICGIWRICG